MLFKSKSKKSLVRLFFLTNVGESNYFFN